MRAYSVDRHRHTPEIEQELSKLAGGKITVRFTPHLIPMDRGLLVTSYASAIRKLDTEELSKVFQKFYAQEPFVRILPPGTYPNTKQVRGTNYCDIAVHYDVRAEKVVILSALDNLNKGAAGQAIQNMNLMSGLNESLGLTQTALIP